MCRCVTLLAQQFSLPLCLFHPFILWVRFDHFNSVMVSRELIRTVWSATKSWAFLENDTSNLTVQRLQWEWEHVAPWYGVFEREASKNKTMSFHICFLSLAWKIEEMIEHLFWLQDGKILLHFCYGFLPIEVLLLKRTVWVILKNTS